MVYKISYNIKKSNFNFKKGKEFTIKKLESWALQVVYINRQSALTPKPGEQIVEVWYIETEFKRLMG